MCHFCVLLRVGEGVVTIGAVFCAVNNLFQNLSKSFIDDAPDLVTGDVRCSPLGCIRASSPKRTMVPLFTSILSIEKGRDLRSTSSPSFATRLARIQALHTARRPPEPVPFASKAASGFSTPHPLHTFVSAVISIPPVSPPRHRVLRPRSSVWPRLGAWGRMPQTDPLFYWPPTHLCDGGGECAPAQ